MASALCYTRSPLCEMLVSEAHLSQSYGYHNHLLRGIRGQRQSERARAQYTQGPQQIRLAGRQLSKRTACEEPETGRPPANQKQAWPNGAERPRKRARAPLTNPTEFKSM